ncbi:MAG: hypothetical protein V4689_05295 [Verrucomicrobiota bacterium]
MVAKDLRVKVCNKLLRGEVTAIEVNTHAMEKFTSQPTLTPSLGKMPRHCGSISRKRAAV